MTVCFATGCRIYPSHEADSSHPNQNFLGTRAIVQRQIQRAEGSFINLVGINLHRHQSIILSGQTPPVVPTRF